MCQSCGGGADSVRDVVPSQRDSRPPKWKTLQPDPPLEDDRSADGSPSKGMTAIYRLSNTNNPTPNTKFLGSAR